MTERLKLFISHLGISDSAFAKSCGIAQNTLSRQLGGVRELSLSTIVAVNTRYPELSLLWLFSGKGQMIAKEEQMQDAMSSERVSKLLDTIAVQQDTINTQAKRIKDLEEINRKQSAELVMLKNERNIG